MRRQIVIDTDPGIDDAVAILLALAAPEELEILGIVVVAGNLPLTQTERNARRVCELAGRADVPVYAGCTHPLLRRLATAEGQSQQALGQALGITANRMVFLVDDLEEHGLVERRRNPSDRRSHALYPTPRGHQALRDAAAATARHGELGRSLSAPERRQLAELLRRVAAEQGIDEHALPGPPPGRRIGSES